jgi:hypothetical protein
MNMIEEIKSALFGVALGVPVECCSREKLRRNPVTKMEGGENTAHLQPRPTRRRWRRKLTVWYMNCMD